MVFDLCFQLLQIVLFAKIVQILFDKLLEVTSQRFKGFSCFFHFLCVTLLCLFEIKILAFVLNFRKHGYSLISKIFLLQGFIQKLIVILLAFKFLALLLIQHFLLLL